MNKKIIDLDEYDEEEIIVNGDEVTMKYKKKKSFDEDNEQIKPTTVYNG